MPTCVQVARHLRAGRSRAAGRLSRQTACGRTARSDGLPLQPAAFPLRQAAPDTEALVVRERVLQALGPNLAAPADPFGLAGRPAFLRKERLRIGLGAQGPILPGRLSGLVRADAERFVHKRDDCVSHSAPPPLATPSAPWRPARSCQRITLMKLHARVLPNVKADT